MKALNEDKSISVAANTDRRFLPNLQHALGDLADSFRPECGLSFHRDIDFGDWKVLALEHGPYLFGRDPDDQHTEKCRRYEDATSASARSGSSLLASVYPAAANAPTLSDARARPAPGRAIASASGGVVGRRRAGRLRLFAAGTN